MADFGAPVAQNVNVNPQQGIQTLSGILGLQSQRLGIQQQQQALQGQAAQVQQEQQTARQRAGIASFMQNFDPTQHIGADGTIDLDGVFGDPKLRAAAGDQFPQLMQQMLQVKQTQLQAKQQLVNLNDSARTQFMGIIGGLRTDPDVVNDTPAGRQKVQQAIGQFEASGPDAARVGQIYEQAFNHAPQGKLAQVVSNAQLQAMDASAQSGRQAPTYVGAGNRLEQTNPQAAGGAPQGNIGVGAPPGWQFDPVTKSWHPTSALGPGSGVTQQSTAQPATQPPKQAAPTPGTGGTPIKTVAGAPQYGPGQADTISANTASGSERYNALVATASESPARVNVLDNIIRLAGDTRTGPGSGWKAAAETAIGQTPGFQGAKDDAARYNELSKFLHQNALRSWQAAGGTGTNQQLSTIEGANPNTTQDPQTIVALAKYNKAGELALQAKANAHQAWMHQPGNNFANQSDFENEWRQHFDPILYQVKVAQMSGDTAGARSLLTNLGKDQLNKIAADQQYLKGLGVY